MELIAPLFGVVTPWHWLGLALILLGLEMALGTYDLLWISGAAFITTAWSILPPVLMPVSGWEVEAIVFCVASLVLLILGRTVFSGWREAHQDKANLNNRANALVGKPAQAVTDFVGGEGRVRLGDSTWMAVSTDQTDIQTGQEVRVEGVDGTILQVSGAD